MPQTTTTQSRFVTVDSLNIHFLQAGQGETILLLHGWPTSSYLWRNIIPILAESHQVIALDLPGFGKSDKPLDRSNSFNYYTQIIEGCLEELGIEDVHLGVHDLGGPIGLHWAVRHPQKIRSLILLNTLVYPDFSNMVKIFGAATLLPGVRHWLASPAGIKFSMRFGVSNKKNIVGEVLQAYQEPFQTREARKALLTSVHNLSAKGYEEIVEKLPDFEVPVRIIYGEQDKILPKVADTMARVKQDLPQAEISSLPNAGHFCQEDAPERIGKMIRDFLSKQL